ncbi:helix-turn-helix domain-containing protein [Halolamina sp. CBA1230]|uniref:bacterio-opsin activator domain-containing protein n=1 Tax=Halolamina sp. CBA1230 TaxID=1853690 RepID=UPI0009A1E532|nr:bacterio-opsin activator domain-containing protein [Halolamina sp. CBA1230]QKY19913.1 helix-turn-helix domain-containing protein [Halolamina sp. CBA1230]
MSLPPASYDRLRRATRTHREELVVRLAGEAGLRPVEQARLRPEDVLEHEGTQLVAVHSESTAAAREAGESPAPARETVLPDGVAHDLRQYAASNGIADDEPLFSVSPRRLAMLIREVSDRVDGVDATAPDLRDFFAADLLDDGVPPHIVAEAGGWERLDSLAPLLPEADRDALVQAVEERSQGSNGVSGLARPVLAVARELPHTLYDAEDRDEVAATVCDRLADAEAVRFAWLAERTDETVTLRHVAGVPERTVRDHLDDNREAMEDVAAEGSARELPGPDGAIVVAHVPGGDADGALLAVGTSKSVDDAATDAVAAVAGQTAHALAAVQRKRLLLSDSAVELEFRCPAAASTLADLSTALDCRIELSGIVPVDGDALLFYAAVEGADAEPVLTRVAATDAVDDARLLEGYDDGAAIELVLTATPVRPLVEHGGRVRSLAASDGVTTLTAELPGDADVRAAVDAVTDAHPSVGLTAKRQVDRPVETDAGFRERLGDRLSERQTTVLRAAYHAGYFEWPRDTTAEELADSVGVSAPTLHNHLRNAEGKLLTAFFEDPPARD